MIIYLRFSYWFNKNNVHLYINKNNRRFINIDIHYKYKNWERGTVKTDGK
jgi:hypothetical protein